MDQASGTRAETSPPTFPVRTWITVALLAVLVYAAFVFLGDLRGVKAHVAEVRPSTAFLALGVVAVGYFVRATRWHMFVAPDSQRPNLWGSTLSFLSGFSMAITPGKVGELVKTFYQWERDGTPVPASIGATLAERGLDVLALLLLMTLGIREAPPGTAWLIGAALAITMCGIAVLRSPRWMHAILGRLLRLRFLARFADSAERGRVNLHRSLSGGRLALGIVMGVAAWSLEPLAMQLLARDVGLSLSYPFCALIFGAGTLVSVLTFLPGGLGVFEGGAIVLLTTLAGASLSQATAVTLLLRLATLWFGVAVGLLAVVWLRATGPSRRLPQPA